jgi:hypothetical protein
MVVTLEPAVGKVGEGVEEKKLAWAGAVIHVGPYIDFGKKMYRVVTKWLERGDLKISREDSHTQEMLIRSPAKQRRNITRWADGHPCGHRSNYAGCERRQARRPRG